jgi:pimeloyl-ACP methyl ester carboxylesterase
VIPVHRHAEAQPIGIGFAEERPELFKNIILGNTWAWPTTKSEPRGLWSVIAGGQIGEFLQMNFNVPFQRVDHRGIAAFYPHEITAERDYFLGLDAGLLRRRSKPTLIFWGSKDSGFLGSDLARWEKVLPHHRTIMLPNASHFFFEDAPHRVTNEMHRFLTSETTNANEQLRREGLAEPHDRIHSAQL